MLESPFESVAPYAWQELPYDTPPGVVDALGGREAYHAAVRQEPVRVISYGKAFPWPRRGDLHLEDGSCLKIDGQLPADLPMGYHHFSGEGGETRVIITPGRCLRPAGRKWGWAVQLHSLLSQDSWGYGDLADLHSLAGWAAGCGATAMLVNPLVASAPTVPQNKSPYYPTTRRFRNPLYLRIEQIPGADRLGSELERLAAEGRALNGKHLLDRDRVFALKSEALQKIFSGFGHDDHFDYFCREQGDSLAHFALYCTIAEEFGADWRHWPQELRRYEYTGTREYAQSHADRVRYYQWLQWLLEQQLEQAGSQIELMQDLPIGMDPGGADAWQWQDLLASSFTVGAPPDAFNSDGQNWALPPFHPLKLRAAGYEPFAQTIRATLRHARGLRIDHVMGLFRLWWIPCNEHAQRGWYVRYPADDLMGIVALESHRAGAFVVGEDLGTVEPGVRELLAARNILSCRLLWFEPTTPEKYPELAMATVTTHDLPTIAGLWNGSDAQAQKAIGLNPGDEMQRLRDHLKDLLHVASDAPVDEVIVKAYRRLAEAPSQIVMATLEDALAMPERPNMPGTVDQWPNWSIPLAHDISALEHSKLAGRIGDALARR